MPQRPSRVAFTIRACSLLACRSQRSQAIWFHASALPEDAHMDESTFICFSSYEGSTSFLVTIDHAGSRPACAAELKRQLLSVRLPDGICFLQRSSARHSINPPRGVPASMRRNVGFTMFRLNNADDLAPACYTGSRIVRAPGILKTGRLTAHHFGWSLSASLARYI